MQLKSSDCTTSPSAIYSIVSQFLSLSNQSNINLDQTDDLDEENENNDQENLFDDQFSFSDQHLNTSFDRKNIYNDLNHVKITRNNSSLLHLVHWYNQNWKFHFNRFEKRLDDLDEDGDEDNDDNDNDDSDDDEIEINISSDDDNNNKNKIKKEITMKKLTSEKRKKNNKKNNTKKQNKKNQNKKIKKESKKEIKQIKQIPSLVIIMEDFECFLPSIAQMLVANCTQYLDRIPIIFVIGIATTIHCIHQILPRSICSRLSIEKFCFDQSNLLLKKILVQLFVEKQISAISPSYSAWKFIFHRFEESNISIETFLRSLHVCYFYLFLFFIFYLFIF